MFGAKPKMVIKGGLINWSIMGIRTLRCRHPSRLSTARCLAPFGQALPETCVSFVSRAAYDSGIANKLGLKRKVMPVYGTRTITKRDMVRNGLTPKIEVNPETFAVKVDGCPCHGQTGPVHLSQSALLFS